MSYSACVHLLPPVVEKLLKVMVNGEGRREESERGMRWGGYIRGVLKTSH